MSTKLIEVALPLDAINAACQHEKSVPRKGHPATMHLWWARRPLAACRAVLFAQLVDDPSAHPDLFPTEVDQERERQRLFDIIKRLVPWEGSSDEKVLGEARREIQRSYPGGPPTIVDPFCGGGSISIEAQRLGLETHASDLNPVAVLITKALIELPPKFFDRSPVHPDSGSTFKGIDSWRGARGLAEDVRYYGSWMRDEAERRLGYLYPKAVLLDGTEPTVIAWLWARTVTCPNPACGATMPLVSSFWLRKKPGTEVWVRAAPDRARKNVNFGIGSDKEGPAVVGTKQGRGTGFICLVCKSPVSQLYVHDEIDNSRSGVQLMTSVAQGARQRTYLTPTPQQELAAQCERPAGAPDEPARGTFGGNAQGRRYGFRTFSDYFTNRQLTALCTFADLVGEAREHVLSDSDGDTAYANAVATYLACSISKLSDWSSSTCSWIAQIEGIRDTFARQAISMVWDFAEINPFSRGVGNFLNHIEWVAAGLDHIVVPQSNDSSATQSSAETAITTSCVVSTDPPYYDNIGYADLSDFFYVWLRRSLGHVYPELFATVLTPKTEELIASPYRFAGNKQKAEEHFERGFKRVFATAAKHAEATTPMTIFYAFKQSESDEQDDGGTRGVASTGWEKMLQGLLESGLMVTGTWPMRTERSGRSVEIGTNALASSIVLVCRPRPDAAGVTDRRGFVQALKGKLGHGLRDLQSGGIAPVDLAQAAIGPGMAVFSSYAKVVEADGRPMRVRTALALINQGLDEVTAEQEGEFDEDTRWAIAWYGEQGMEDGSYGRADDLSRAKNVSVDGLVRAGLVKSGGGKVRLLKRDELDPDWDPTTDPRLTVWEVTQHLIRRLLNDGEASAADLLSKVGGLGDAARDLSYRLFQVAEAKKWAKEAGPYNALAASWLEISRMAAAGADGQGSLPGLRVDGDQ
jgi:putative DNA methylase